jgi:uncharacterized OsmC-like protein
MEINIQHKGGMGFRVNIREHTIISDQPKDKGGMNEGPTPAELFVASLGSCIGVYAIWFCQKNKISYEAMKLNLVWAKSTTPPARIEQIDVTVSLPDGCPEALKKGLHEQVEKCLVHNTITNPPEINITV